MVTATHRPADTWSPLHFLASLGAGGLAVTCFMYLTLSVPHPGQQVPVFEVILGAFAGGGLPMKAAILVAVTGIAGLAVLNIKMLIWTLARYSEFKETEGCTKLVNSNGAIQPLTMPLALARSVNAGLIIGPVFVPGLRIVVEYLFPLSMATLAAMSALPLVVGVSLIASITLCTVAAFSALVAAIVAFNSMLHNSTATESAPTLMVFAPILNYRHFATRGCLQSNPSE